MVCFEIKYASKLIDVRFNKKISIGCVTSYLLFRLAHKSVSKHEGGVRWRHSSTSSNESATNKKLRKRSLSIIKQPWNQRKISSF